jgi:hypothetical protein
MSPGGEWLGLLFLAAFLGMPATGLGFRGPPAARFARYAPAFGVFRIPKIA